MFSLLDTDLYKLTMQCAVLKYFPTADVTYAFTNRTPDMLFTREAFDWLHEQIMNLENISLSPDELAYLRREVRPLNPAYLDYLSTFRLHPARQVDLTFEPTGSARDTGKITLTIRGGWAETILYEIPLLALTSEAYFKFVDRDWDHAGQEARAYEKGARLLRAGCAFSEFGSRRRRDYATHDLVMRGLCRAAREGREKGWPGTFLGTSNVHFARKYGVPPVGTVAHEWYMGLAAITDNYEGATELGLRYWVGTFGEGVLGIALTDTFGTPAFLKAFNLPVPRFASSARGADSTLPSASSSSSSSIGQTVPPPPTYDDATTTDSQHAQPSSTTGRTYAQVFAGVRQDSGDPKEYIKTLSDYYDSIGIAKTGKVIVFSDSLNIERCLEYKELAEAAGFSPSFGVGTFMTSTPEAVIPPYDFTRLSDGSKSAPLNIVIKISSAGGRPAVKLSDNLGKNTGDHQTVVEVKKRLGYIEREWKGGDEQHRWDAPRLA
ncbi:nicotinate phosphoribosyltransferase [Ascosphaera acerosa]|nr:nicotinate phosphoribosyltransferase [Ascosphaera acerosa]